MKNLKIGIKLALAFAVVLLIMLTIGGREYFVLNSIEEKKQDILKSFDMADAIMEAKYFLTADRLMLMEILEAESKEDVNAMWNEHVKAVEGFDTEMEALANVAADESWGVEFADLKEEAHTVSIEADESHNDVIGPAYDEVLVEKLKLVELLSSASSKDDYDQLLEIQKLEGSLLALDGKIDAKAEEIVLTLFDAEEIIEKMISSSTIAADQLSERSKTEMIILVAFGILLSITFAYIITRAIAVPIGKGVEFAKLVASGDLTADIDIDQKDEVGILIKSLKEMIVKLREVVGGVVSGSDNIAAASQEMSANSQQVSEGASEQASSAEEVSSSMEQMSANIQQNTDNAQQTEKIAAKAAEDINEGSSNVNNTVESMKAIAEKVSIIGDIAFQTNILALNAAVEAARAGEHGKGFAVVAAEVRKLAERSQVAAGEIDDLSKSSVDVADKSGKLLEAIVPDIQKTSQLVQEITAASLEQNSGADQINSAISQLNQVTQQNAAASEEMATSSEELSSQAMQLREIISFFKVEENGTKRSNRKKVVAVHNVDSMLNKNGKKSSGSQEETEKIEQPQLEGAIIDMGNNGNGGDFNDADFEKY